MWLACLFPCWTPQIPRLGSRRPGTCVTVILGRAWRPGTPLRSAIIPGRPNGLSNSNMFSSMACTGQSQTLTLPSGRKRGCSSKNMSTPLHPLTLRASNRSVSTTTGTPWPMRSGDTTLAPAECVRPRTIPLPRLLVSTT